MSSVNQIIQALSQIPTKYKDHTLKLDMDLLHHIYAKLEEMEKDIEEVEQLGIAYFFKIEFISCILYPLVGNLPSVIKVKEVESLQGITDKIFLEVINHFELGIPVGEMYKLSDQDDDQEDEAINADISVESDRKLTLSLTLPPLETVGIVYRNEDKTYLIPGLSLRNASISEPVQIKTNKELQELVALHESHLHITQSLLFSPRDRQSTVH